MEKGVSDLNDRFGYPVGALVEYYSSSKSRWILARVQVRRLDGLYDLDCKANVSAENIRPSQQAEARVIEIPSSANTEAAVPALGPVQVPAMLPAVVTAQAKAGGLHEVGSEVRYFDETKGSWVTAKVRAYDSASDTYTLDPIPPEQTTSSGSPEVEARQPMQTVPKLESKDSAGAPPLIDSANKGMDLRQLLQTVPKLEYNGSTGAPPLIDSANRGPTQTTDSTWLSSPPSISMGLTQTTDSTRLSPPPSLLHSASPFHFSSEPTTSMGLTQTTDLTRLPSPPGMGTVPTTSMGYTQTTSSPRPSPPMTMGSVHTTNLGSVPNDSMTQDELFSRTLEGVVVQFVEEDAWGLLRNPAVWRLTRQDMYFKVSDFPTATHIGAQVQLRACFDSSGRLCARSAPTEEQTAPCPPTSPASSSRSKVIVCSNGIHRQMACPALQAAFARLSGGAGGKVLYDITAWLHNDITSQDQEVIASQMAARRAAARSRAVQLQVDYQLSSCEPIDLSAPDFDVSSYRTMLASANAYVTEGGNTWALWHWMRKREAYRHITELVKAGSLLYVGISAGAIVTGRSVSTAFWKGWDEPWAWQETFPALERTDWHDQRNIVGMDLLGGLSFFPHYSSSYSSLFIDKSCDMDHPVVFIADGHGISFERSGDGSLTRKLLSPEGVSWDQPWKPDVAPS